MVINTYQDRAGGWRWRAIDTNGRIIADSAEGYDSERNLRRALDNVVGEFRGAIAYRASPRKLARAAEWEAA